MNPLNASRRQKVLRVWNWVNDMVRRLAVPLAIGLFVYAFVVTTQRNHTEARDRHDAVQQNVRARFDDCQNSNAVRAARRTEILQSKVTEPLLYKLLPALDTPEVRATIKAQNDAQLKAYHDVDCKVYALEAVPVDQRGDYTVPSPRPKAKPIPPVTAPSTTPTTP